MYYKKETYKIQISAVDSGLSELSKFYKNNSIVEYANQNLTLA